MFAPLRNFVVVLEIFFYIGSALAASFSRPRAEVSWGIFETISPSCELEWQDCIPGFQCAVLDVPLDYNDLSNGRAWVPLLKYPASSGPYRGMILTNPGGPGETAISFLNDSATSLAAIVGSNYDVVAWEPRGIGYSSPLANCSAPDTRIVSRDSTDFHGPELSAEWFDTVYNDAATLGKQCQTAIGGTKDIGPYMHTAVNARDMLSIVDAFAASTYSNGVEGASLLNYWGFSYGTFIGQTYASMFPSRVGRVVLDGVIDPEDTKYLKGVEDCDAAFGTFFTYCDLAGPDLCPYSTNTTARDISARFSRTTSRLDSTTAHANNWANATALDQGLFAIKLLARSGAIDPITAFPKLASLLIWFENAVHNFTSDSITDLESTLNFKISTTDPGTLPEWLGAIACTDNGGVLEGESLSDLQPSIRESERQSYIGGELLSAVFQIACAGWTIKGRGVFLGPFRGTTKTPMLFVSNTLDPATAISHGRKMVRKFSKAQLLTIDGVGHTSLPVKNSCAFGKINTYFQTGNLPGREHTCAQEAGAFNITLPHGLERG